MPSVASFMMPAGKAVTACPEDKLRSVVDSLVNEKDRVRRCGRRGQSRRHHHEAGCQQVLPLRGENSTSTPASHVSLVPQSDPAPKATTRNDPIHAPIRPDTPPKPIPTNEQPLTVRVYPKPQKVLGRVFSVSLLPRHPAADPTGHSREPGHEHQPAPGEARHAQGRRRGAAPARKDPPRRRRQRGRSVRRLVLVLGHREGVRSWTQR